MSFRHARLLSAIGLMAYAAGAISVLAWLRGGALIERSVDTVAAAAPVLRADAIARVARQRADAVVFLHTVMRGEKSDRAPAEPPWQDLLRPVQEGLGSGVVIDATGLILTNAHVVQRAALIHVRTADGDDLDATVVGADPDTDLALLRVSDPTGLRPAPLGDSDRLNVGDYVIAIGNPLGLHHTVTAGILSAKGRRLDGSGVEFLQTDASINPGSSGGALVDLDGSVVGITSGVVSDQGGSIGLNFAIPINVAKELLPDLRAGSVVHGWIGVATFRLTRAGARAVGVAAPADGLFVSEVASDGPAARAELRVGDVLLGAAAQPPVSALRLERYVTRSRPGSAVRLLVLRRGQRIEIPVTVAARPTGPTAGR